MTGSRPRSGRWPTRWLDLYVAAVSAWLMAWLILGDRNGWLALANAWAFWWLAGGLPAGAAALWPRGRWWAVAWLVALLHLLRLRFPMGQTAASHTVPGPNGSVSLVVSGISFNLLKAARNLEPVVQMLAHQQPDFVLFQELMPAHSRQLAQRLAPYFPYRCWYPYAPTQMGFGIASRIPFAVTGLWADPGLEPFALRVTLSLSATGLDLYIVQFISPTNEVRALGVTPLLWIRQSQVDQILQAVAHGERPAVVVGDWNSTQGSDIYRQAAAHLVDGWQQGGRGPGFTWPRGLLPGLPPLLRLDHCFHTPQIRTRRIEVIDGPLGSDHCPIHFELQLGGERDVGPRHGNRSAGRGR